MQPRRHPDDADDTDDTGAARRRRLAAAVLVALGCAFAVVVVTARGSTGPTGRLGGDYPAFYTAGELVLDGRFDELYELDAQAAVQADLQGGEQGFLAFAYPPHVALLYTPLAALPYRAAYAVHTLAMVAACVGALWLLRPRIALLDREFPVVVAGALTSLPLFVALGLGQNTALTLLLGALVWRGLTDRRPVLAGIAAGLMWYRPQYGIPLTGLLLVGRQTAAVVWAGGVVAVSWLIGVAWGGWGWVGTWLDAVSRFVELDGSANAHNAVTPYGAVEALTAPASTAALATWAVAGGAAAAVLVLVWHHRVGTGKGADVDLAMAIALAGLLVVSNHSLYYDLGLLVPGVCLVADRGLAGPHLMGGRLLAGAWLLALTHLTAPALGVDPLALAPLALVALLASTALRRSASIATGATLPGTPSLVSGAPR